MARASVAWMIVNGPRKRTRAKDDPKEYLKLEDTAGLSFTKRPQQGVQLHRRSDALRLIAFLQVGDVHVSEETIG